MVFRTENPLENGSVSLGANRARQEGREQESEERSWSHQALSEGKQRISLLCPGGRCLISGTGSSSFRPAVTFGPLDRRRLDGDEEEGPEAREAEDRQQAEAQRGVHEADAAERGARCSRG